MKCNIVTLASEYVFGSYLKESKHCIEFIGKKQQTSSCLWCFMSSVKLTLENIDKSCALQ